MLLFVTDTKLGMCRGGRAWDAEIHLAGTSDAISKLTTYLPEHPVNSQEHELYSHIASVFPPILLFRVFTAMRSMKYGISGQRICRK